MCTVRGLSAREVQLGEQSPQVIEARASLAASLRVREKAHAKLDEALDMYEQGAPLHIVQRMSWSSGRVDDVLRIEISPRYA